MTTSRPTGIERASHDATVFLFPGQGNDPRGALTGLRRAIAQHRPTLWDKADQVLDDIDRTAAAHGYGPTRAVLLAARPTADLDYGMPQLAQFAASTVLSHLLRDSGLRPQTIVGQSLGEYSALICAGAFTVAEGTRMVCVMNTHYREFVGRGAMVLVRADAEATRTLLTATHPDLAVSCLNAPQQTIVSGPTEAIAALLARNASGAPRLHRLPLPYASHHPSLRKVLDLFLDDTSDLRQRPLRIPVISPTLRRAYTDADDLREGIIENTIKPLYLMETLHGFDPPGQRLFVEVGIGDSLIRCLKTLLPAARTFTPLTPQSNGNQTNFLARLANEAQIRAADGPGDPGLLTSDHL